jgi:hypothetical protein
MTRLFRQSRALRALLISVLGLTIFVGPVQGANATSFSGRATVVNIDVNNAVTGADLANLVLADAGPLPPSGGSELVEVLNVDNAPPIDLEASLLRARTEGAGSTALSVARAANLDLTVAGVTVSSTTLRSTATAVCGGDGAVVSGASLIEGLTISGFDPITVTGQPNQTITVGPVQVIINEQTSTVAPDGSAGEITVTALHITVDNVLVPNTLLADVILSRAHADVTCPVQNGRISPEGDIGGPCADPAYYGIFDNSDSSVALTFRYRWYNGNGLQKIVKVVPAGAIYRTWEKWAKPGTPLRVAYKHPTTGNWINLASDVAGKGYYPPCVYQRGYDYTN